MAKKTKRKMLIAVLAVVVAGIVYCVIFAEEKNVTVQYLTGEESHDTNPTQDTTENPGVSVGTTEEQKEEKLIYVHICGAVKMPGVYILPEGSRVCKVIASAGGMTEEAAADYVNQARFLTDGERVYIPEKEELTGLSASEYAAGESVPGDTSAGTSLYPVNINTAGLSELMTLPGVGQSRAESIISYREQYGAFTKVEDIMQISGIKGAAYEKLKDRICVGP